MKNKVIPSEDELGILKANLIDQYFRAGRSIDIYKEKILLLPKGYISKKIISGKDQYYLQWRENGKIRSLYINRNDLEKYENGIKVRKKNKKSLKYLLQQKKEIEKFVGKEIIEYYGNK